MIACFECVVKKRTYTMEVDGNTKGELMTNAKKLAKTFGVKKKVAWKLIWGAVSRRRKDSEIKAES